ncbi:hypothetical protein NIES2101_24035 [Calothrix sp. HK-06]|nr:hypothetical protein NIES2101_23900 [Calothrix sp. HK-06]OKH47337.1 hypothetical protein NIES2101_24035 [Calothrix sp. HK-06]
MTRFNPDRKHKTPEEWSQEAYRVTSSNNLQFHVIGGLIISVLVAGATTPITGGLIAAYTLWTAWKRSDDIQRNQSAIIEAGCIAQVLEGDNFQDYLAQCGHNSVISELDYAKQRGLPLSNDAIDYLEALPEVTPVKSIAMGAEYGDINRASHATNKTAIETYNPSTSSQIDIVGEMTNRIQNIFGVGQGGSGKGMLLANACRAVKAKHPGKKIFLINGKDDPKEHSYFAGVVDVEKRLHCETAKPQTVAAWFEASISQYDDFAVQNNGALLIVDEGTIIGTKLKDAKSNALNDKIIGITSCGGSTGKNIWVFVQTPFASGSGSTLSAISQMISIVVVRGDAIGVLEQWKRSALFNKFNKSEVTELANNSHCNRAVYWGGSASWYSMPKLTNHSAYDRDSGQYLSGFAQQSENKSSNLDAITKLENSLHSNLNTEESMSDTSLLIFHWLLNNRLDKWVKFKGKEGRDMSFIKFLSDNKIDAEERNNAIEELVKLKKIDISPESDSIKAL